MESRNAICAQDNITAAELNLICFETTLPKSNGQEKQLNLMY